MPENDLQKEAKVLGLLGLAARAGKLVTGTQPVCDSLRTGGILLIIEAADTSDNTHKKLSDKSAYYKTPLYRLTVTGEELGRRLGKAGPIAAAGVTDVHFADGIRAAL